MIKPKGLAYWAALTMALGLVGQGAGFVRELTYGYFFGASAAFDAFTIVFGFILFMGSLISAILFIAIPMLTKSYNNQDSQKFSETLTSLALLIAVPVLVVIFLGEIFANKMLMVIGPGLVANPDAYSVAIRIIRLGLPISLLMCGTHILRSILNITNNYFISGLESLIFNLGIVSVTVVWFRASGVANIYAPIIGVYLAYGIFLLIGCFSVKLPLKLHWRFDASSMNMVLSAGSWLYVGTLFAYLTPVVLMWHASFLDKGSASAMGYVSRILVFSLALFVNSVMTVFLPAAARLAMDGDRLALAVQTEKLLKVVLYISVGVVYIILLEKNTLVAIIYERGKFTEADTMVLANLLNYYVPWMIFFPISAIAIRILYVFQYYRVISMVSLGCLILVVCLAPIMRSHFGVNGLGAISSMHMMVYGGSLAWLVRKKLGRLGVLSIFLSLLKLVFVLSVLSLLIVVETKIFSNIKILEIFFVACLFIGIVLVYVNKVVRLKKLIGRSAK